MAIRSTRRLLAALAAVITAAGAGLLAADPAMAGTSTGTVTGHVVTTDGSPAADVPISLTTTVVHEYPEDPVDLSHVHTYSVSTDAAGDYTVPDAQQGRYTVTVAPSSVWTIQGFSGSVTVVPGVATAPTTTAVRLATIHGTVAATEDGAQLGGAAVSAYSLSSTYQASSNDGNVLSVGDGGFTIHVPPGSIHLQIDASDRFSVSRTLTVAEDGTVDLGTVDLDPSGEVVTRILGRSGHPIQDLSQSAVVDGCRIDAGLVGTCPGVRDPEGPGMTRLQFAPGTHTIRYEVRNPVSTIVRHVTRTVVVTAGRTTTLSPVVVRADPFSAGTVRAGTYSRGHAVVVRVAAPSYIDGTRPRLRTTFLVAGHAVSPTSVSWRKTAAGAQKVLVATLPVRWSTRATLSVRAVTHGTAAYAGVTTKAVTLTRAR